MNSDLQQRCLLTQLEHLAQHFHHNTDRELSSHTAQSSQRIKRNFFRSRDQRRFSIALYGLPICVSVTSLPAFMWRFLAKKAKATCLCFVTPHSRRAGTGTWWPGYRSASTTLNVTITVMRQLHTNYKLTDTAILLVVRGKRHGHQYINYERIRSNK